MPAVAGATASPARLSSSSAAPADVGDRQFRLGTLAIVALSLALGLFRLGTNDVWFDEAASLFFARQPIGNFIRDIIANDTHGPLYYAFLKLWTALVGERDWLCRLPSVLCGTATVWLTVQLGAKLADRNVALVAAALLTLAPYHLYYAQEIRFYSFVECMAALNVLCFVHLTDPQETPAWRAWIGFVASALGFLLTFYMSMLLLLAEAVCVAVLWKRIPRKLWIVTAFLTTGVLFAIWLPWLWWQIRHTSGSIAWIPPKTPWVFVPKLMRVFAAGEHALWPSDIAAGIFSLAALVAILRTARHRRLLPIACWLLVPLAVAMAISVRRPLVVSRYYLMLMPAFYLLVAVGFGRTPRWARIALGSVALAAVLFADVHYYRTPKFPERWREATAYVQKQSVRTEVVAAFPHHKIAELTYYFPGRDTVRGVAPGGGINRLLSPGRRLWLLSAAKDMVAIAPWISPRAIQVDHQMFGTLELRVLLMP